MTDVLTQRALKTANGCHGHFCSYTKIFRGSLLTLLCASAKCNIFMTSFPVLVLQYLIFCPLLILKMERLFFTYLRLEIYLNTEEYKQWHLQLFSINFYFLNTKFTFSLMQFIILWFLVIPIINQKGP